MTKPKAKPSTTAKAATLGKASNQTETDYLNSNPTNAARLQKSKSKIGLGQRMNTQSLPAFDMQALATEVARQLGANVASTGSLSNCDSPNVSYGSNIKSVSIGTSLKAANPIDNELNLLINNMDEINGLISELNTELEPVLAHEEDSDKEGEVRPSRSSDSPLHRRLIDRNEQLTYIIGRLRYLKSRVRN